jgi:hypothetical protein
MTAAHDAVQSHRYLCHFPEHPARPDDPHYVDFDHYHRTHRATARCFIGERIGYTDCRDAQGNSADLPVPEDGVQLGLELHHAHIEFSLQNGVDLAALEHDYPGISDPDSVGAWVETEQNFRWLCVTGGSPVLMADGSTKPIEVVVVGDLVIGHDGLAHPVTATRRKRHRGEVVTFGSASFTPEHRILGCGGWTPAGDILSQVGVHGPDVVRVRGEQQQVLSHVVGPVSIDVMDPFTRRQGSADPRFHDRPVLHDQSIAVVDPDVAMLGDLTLGTDTRVPLRQLVESSEPALIGAELRGSRPPVSASVKRGAARADQQMGWVAAVPRWATYTGFVHDLSVAHSHSFIAGGIVAHNCAYHHRGASGAHTASHSDWEASQYIKGLLGPIR